MSPSVRVSRRWLGVPLSSLSLSQPLRRPTSGGGGASQRRRRSEPAAALGGQSRTVVRQHMGSAARSQDLVQVWPKTRGNLHALRIAPSRAQATPSRCSAPPSPAQPSQPAPRTSTATAW